MTATYATFVAVFDEFAQEAQAKIDFWLGQGVAQLNANRFKDQIDLAVMLFAAHNIALGKQASENAKFDGPLGRVVAPISSESVDKVNVTLATDQTMSQGAGAWNATVYGQRLWQLFKTYNLGPAYVPARQRVFGLWGARAWPWA